MEKISIIVPIYNVAPYLPACLDSIIHQTYLNLEIILVDDGSTDSSNKICEQYKTVDPRIQVIHQKNQGVSTARNAGLALAAGHYITFADADDLLEPSLLAECIKAIETGQTDVLYHGFKKDVWKSGKVSSSLKGIPSFEGVLSKNQMKDYILAQKRKSERQCIQLYFYQRIDCRSPVQSRSSLCRGCGIRYAGTFKSPDLLLFCKL